MSKVVLLHYAAPPVVGGVEQVLAHQAELMVKAGHTVEVVAGRGSRWDPSIPVRVIPEIDSRHPMVIRLKKDLDIGRIPPEFALFQEKLFQTLRKVLAGVDVIIAHNVASLHKNLALTAALRQFADQPHGTRVILWHHDFAWNSQRYQREMYPGFPWDLLKTVWPGVEQVTISEARQQEMCEIYQIPASQIKVVPNGIDPAEFQNLAPGTRKLADQFDLNLAFPLLLTPVRLTRRKNLEFGLQILTHLVKLMPAVRWVVTGPAGAHNPDNAAYFQQLIDLRRALNLEKQAVFMAEYRPEGLTNGQVGDFYSISDALLITSQEEGFGLPIIEAGLTRLPIFTTDLQPLQALGGQWATYFQLDDSPADIARRIARQMSSDPVYRLREHIRANFTWDAIFQQKIAPLLNFQTRVEVR
jgi:glycosyltransferase involved in cell wall biosynthesis